jgi:CheY-like chemotaxis protein
MAKILIVEDNVEMIELIFILLENKGFQVAKASSKEEALLQLDLLGPSLILLDVMLGADNGRDICKEIKQINKDVKVVLISANKALLQDYQECEADATIEKPFESKFIIGKINELLHA